LEQQQNYETRPKNRLLKEELLSKKKRFQESIKKNEDAKCRASKLVLDCKKARGSCVKPWSLLVKNSWSGGPSFKKHWCSLAETVVAVRDLSDDSAVRSTTDVSAINSKWWRRRELKPLDVFRVVS